MQATYIDSILSPDAPCAECRRVVGPGGRVAAPCETCFENLRQLGRRCKPRVALRSSRQRDLVEVAKDIAQELGKTADIADPRVQLAREILAVLARAAVPMGVWALTIRIEHEELGFQPDKSSCHELLVRSVIPSLSLAEAASSSVRLPSDDELTDCEVCELFLYFAFKHSCELEFRGTPFGPLDYLGYPRRLQAVLRKFLRDPSSGENAAARRLSPEFRRKFGEIMKKSASTLSSFASKLSGTAANNGAFRRQLFDTLSEITTSAGPKVPLEEREGIAKCLRVQGEILLMYVAVSRPLSFPLPNVIRGFQGEQSEPRKGNEFLLRAAQMDSAQACFLLSGSFATGNGVPQDKEKSDYWLDRHLELVNDAETNGMSSFMKYLRLQEKAGVPDSVGTGITVNMGLVRNLRIEFGVSQDSALCILNGENPEGIDQKTVLQCFDSLLASGVSNGPILMALAIARSAEIPVIHCEEGLFPKAKTVIGEGNGAIGIPDQPEWRSAPTKRPRCLAKTSFSSQLISRSATIVSARTSRSPAVMKRR